jgi:hypothetical protein
MIWKVSTISVASAATLALSSFTSMQALASPAYMNMNRITITKSSCGQFEPYSESSISNQEREFYSSQYQFSFKIPQNFQVAAAEHNTFLIASDYKLSDYRCTVPMYKPSCPPDNLAQCFGIAMRMRRLTPSDQRRSMAELVASVGARGTSPQRIGTVNGLVIFQHSLKLGDYNTPFVSFISPDKKLLVVIAYSDYAELGERPYEAIITSRMVQTFKFH